MKQSEKIPFFRYNANNYLQGVGMTSFSSLSEKKLLSKKHTPKSPLFMNLLRAFFFGGLICGAGEIIYNILLRISFLSLSEPDASLIVTLIIITISALLTAFGVFDKIARRAGAGTIVPVSGFSNSITSAAIDSRDEGYVLGVGAKIFTVAGPVILYGLLAGHLYGLVYYLYLFFAR